MDPKIMITLRAHAIVASSNFARDEGRQKLDIGSTVDLFAEPKDLLTVLGNIVTGSIRTNGAPLGAPWNPLNLQNTSL